MTHETRDETVRSMLKAGDPAADGREPTSEEVAHLRARVLDAARVPYESPADEERPAAVIHPHCAPDLAARIRWTPAALAFAALFAVLVLGLVTLRVTRPAPTGSGQPAREAGAGGDPSVDEPRQIHLTTPGGTRVVWLLYPEDTDSDSRAGRGPGGRS
jgi:hypothetical protein